MTREQEYFLAQPEDNRKRVIESEFYQITREFRDKSLSHAFGVALARNRSRQARKRLSRTA